MKLSTGGRHVRILAGSPHRPQGAPDDLPARGRTAVTDLPTTVEGLENLAESGAIALVGAIATEAFQAARSGIGRLFGRRGSKERDAAQARLDEDADLVRRTEAAERDELRDDLARLWRRRLRLLLAEDPESGRELSELVAQIQAVLPKQQQQWTQTNIAHSQGTVYASLGGDVIHYQTPDRRVPPAPGELDDPAE